MSPDFFCTLEEAICLQRLCLSHLVAKYFIDRKSGSLMERGSAIHELAMLVSPNDVLPVWSVLDLGKALGKEIDFNNYLKLEVITTAEYAGLRDCKTDKWYCLGNFEACFDSGREASDRARLLIFCLEAGLLKPEYVNQSINS